MDEKRKKELLAEFKNRKPEMGIISFCYVPTGDSFLMGSQDTKADINSNCFQLEMGNNYNRSLQQLWNEHKNENFQICVLETLPHSTDEIKDNYSEDLEVLLCCHLESNEKARRLKR